MGCLVWVPLQGSPLRPLSPAGIQPSVPGEPKLVLGSVSQDTCSAVRLEAGCHLWPPSEEGLHQGDDGERGNDLFQGVQSFTVYAACSQLITEFHLHSHTGVQGLPWFSR